MHLGVNLCLLAFQVGLRIVIINNSGTSSYLSGSDIRTHGSTILPLSGLSRTSLPQAHTLLFGGNFMVLDISLKTSGEDTVDEYQESVTGSYIDIAFGDDRRGFAGFHRFEVTREIEDKDQRENGGATICYSSVACNPSVNKPPAPAFTTPSIRCTH
jgi:hypothetical protein